ncbi:hypothetical protein LZP73_04270 [Shewanella sp. AS16]|uniref:hypothetical protein n=1 Tax=Shewanella sp. AS16 TaxID=2907625 RepID=UPI001F370445|nr:hypothetical protein [Shewanella sp. AS16]MCE9685433.1 hypothetical protein [Shewanella sp. AS16]
MTKLPLILAALLPLCLTSACAELACSARTDVDPYDPLLDKQRCVEQVEKNMADKERAKREAENKRVKAALADAMSKKP